jgi:hypothetical protein
MVPSTVNTLRFLVISIWATLFLSPSVTAAARILKISGTATYVPNPKLNATANPLTAEVKLEPGVVLEAGKNSFVDIEFVESGSLLRLTDKGRLWIKSDGRQAQDDLKSWKVDVELFEGRLLVIPKFANEQSFIFIASGANSCNAIGTGAAFSFDSEGKLRCYAGKKDTRVTTGVKRNTYVYKVYPPDYKIGYEEELHPRWVHVLEVEINELQQNALSQL